MLIFAGSWEKPHRGESAIQYPVRRRPTPPTQPEQPTRGHDRYGGPAEFDES
jgi:hypothetical protein